MSVFDVPSSAATSTSRDTTTVSPQALFLMNGPLVATAADLVTHRPDVERATPADARVRQIYRVLFGRAPHEIELRLATDYLGPQPSAVHWQQFAQALLLTNEFVFVD